MLDLNDAYRVKTGLIRVESVEQRGLYICYTAAGFSGRPTLKWIVSCCYCYVFCCTKNCYRKFYLLQVVFINVCYH